MSFVSQPFSLQLLALLLALLLDAWLGDPHSLWRYTGHPITWIGRVLHWLERLFNKPHQYSFQTQIIKGMFALVMLLGILASLCHLIYFIIFEIQLHFSLQNIVLINILLEVLLVWPFLCWHSLYQHVNAVALSLYNSDIKNARTELAKIVGRNVTQLDQADIARGACESLAENYSDGILAPVFWYMVGGLYGLVLYKAINTSDSQWGYKSKRYLYFGRASAILDDFANWLPARLCAFAIVIISKPFAGAKIYKQIASTASLHVSPNAGWPESALAIVMDIRLGGPRQYHLDQHQHKLEQTPLNKQSPDYAWLGNGRSQLVANDITQACHLLRRVHYTFIIAIALIAIVPAIASIFKSI